MATRKSRSVNNKRYGKINEESPDKDGDSGGNKSRQRKRKLTDMLGSQWSKEELKRFYEAYRKYGKDWKKVASVVRNRSTEMVEALYNMNRAYLSLPEGMASAAGLTAMMTDHYSILDGSESDRESDDAPGISQKPAKRARGKYQVNGTKGTYADVPDLLKFPPLSSNNGCFSVKKRRTSGGRRAVGKRTPRYAVSHTSDKHEREMLVTPNRWGLKSDLDAHDEEVAHGAALTLAEALQRGGSPQVSQTPKRRSEHLRSSSARNSERKRQHDWHRASTTKRSGVTDENYVEGSGGSMEVENGDFDRDASYMMDTGGVGTVVIKKKGKKSLGRKPKYQDTESSHDNEVREASSGTEKGLNLSHVKEKAGDEVTDSRYGRPRKKNRELKDDEIQALDGLTFLANMSLELGPASESSVQFKEEKRTRGNVDKFGVPENRQRDKSNFSGIKEKSLREVEVTTSKSAKFVRGLTFDVNSLTEEKKPPSQTTTKAQKLKHKHIASKMQSPTNEGHTDLVPDDLQKTEVLEENGKKSIIKANCLGPVAVIPKQGKSLKPPEHSSSSDPVRPGTDAALSTEQVPTLNQVLLPTKHRSRRKMDLQKTLVRRVSNFSEDMGNKRPGKHTSQDGTLDIKEKLSRCLSSPMLRRWCAFEWFYSAIDYPWFAKKEFVEYLNHVGLGHVPRLTRVEWGVIRSSLGKPRRLSQQFLREEKEKLEQYRESVRTHYTELRNGTRDGLPTDLARPLTVGQRVIACHPRTREFHDGSVLTVDRNRCRIQFDRPELGVEFVMDIDCMPLNTFENMPEALRRQNIAAGRLSENLNNPKLNNQSKDRTTGSYKSIAPSAKLEPADVTSQISSPIYPMNTLLKNAEAETISDIAEAKTAANETLKAAYNQPCTLAQIQAREADIRALSELSRALEKKEALVSELSYMNDEVQKNQMNGDNSLKDYDPFKKQYATVLIQLKEANDQVSSALQYLRKRNTYQGNSPPWQMSKPGSGVPVGPFNSIDTSAFLPQEAASHVIGILESSRVKAQTMVDVAVQALLSCKDGGDAFVSIGEALDSASTRQNGTEVRSFTSTDLVNGGSFPYQDAATNFYISKPVTAVYSNGTKQNNSSFDANEVQIPKDLITSCLATLLMVQTCTERQYPPAEVAQILDSAFTSLHPCCSQNLPIYQEIRMCMGLVKNQILALIPT